MAHVLNIVNGSGTITLNSSNHRVLHYVPTPPPIDESTRTAILSGKVSGDGFTVTESARVEFGGTASADIVTALQAVESALEFAALRREQIGAGDRVFITYQPDGGTVAYRSEILDGRVELDSDAQDYGRWFTNFRVAATIAWRRRFFWEHNEEQSITVSNSAGTAGSAAVYMHDDADAGHDNYVQIAAAQVGGVVPAPAKIAITHSYAGTAARRIYTSHKGGGADSFQHIYEAEAATLNGTYAAATADANASGGTVVNVTNVPASAAAIATWPITSAQAALITSQWSKIIGRFSTLPSNSTTKARLLLQDSATTAQIGQGEWVTLSPADAIQILGTLMLSPNLQGQAVPGEMKLVLQMKDSAAVGDLGLDFIQLSPVEGGSGFRILKPVDETLVSIPVSTGLITDNMIDGAVYIESRQNVYIGFGGPIMLMPNKLQRLYFLADGVNALAPIDRTLSIVVSYRPRKLML